MNGEKVFVFPKKLRPSVEAQLDLFEWDHAAISKYNFLDVNDTDQDELLDGLGAFGFKAILDVRIFPSFDMPAYDQNETLLRIENLGIFYFPIRYMRIIGMRYKSIRYFSDRLSMACKKGPLLVIYDKSADEKNIKSYKKLIEDRLSIIAEFHPNSVPW